MAIEMVQDPQWGELRRETGFGIISDVLQQNEARNAQVVIKAEKLKEPVTGWTDTVGQREVHLAALAAYTGGQRVFYRIDTRRKDAADVTPFAELDKRAKIREVQEVTAVDGKGAPLGAPPIVAPPPPPRDPAEGRRPGARVEESRPWTAVNTDGSLNMGSYAVLAAQSMVGLSYDLLLERWRRGETEGPPTEGQLRGLARRLLLAADRTQAAMRADHHADRLDMSHARSRGAVREALKVHPVPFGEPAEVLEAWLEQLVGEATRFMSVVVSLVDREVP